MSYSYHTLPNEVYGYNIAAVPEGFSVIDESRDSRLTFVIYSNNMGSEIRINIGGSSSSIMNIDTEGADSVENINIFGYEGLLIEKENRVHVIWGDTEQEKFISIESVGLGREMTVDIANNMR